MTKRKRAMWFWLCALLMTCKLVLAVCHGGLMFKQLCLNCSLLSWATKRSRGCMQPPNNGDVWLCRGPCPSNEIWRLTWAVYWAGLVGKSNGWFDSNIFCSAFVPCTVRSMNFQHVVVTQMFEGWAAPMWDTVSRCRPAFRVEKAAQAFRQKQEAPIILCQAWPHICEE